MSKDFNGYSFDNKSMRKQMKYIVVINGDLDLNGAYAFRTKKELRTYLKEYKGGFYDKVEAVFEIIDITDIKI